jgi:hypothetical protein
MTRPSQFRKETESHHDSRDQRLFQQPANPVVVTLEPAAKSVYAITPESITHLPITLEYCMEKLLQALSAGQMIASTPSWSRTATIVEPRRDDGEGAQSRGYGG